MKNNFDKQMIKLYAEKFKFSSDVEKWTSAVVLLENGYFLGISKPSINTRFCFADEGPDYEEYKSVRDNKEILRNYFIKENMAKLNRYIKGISEKLDEHGCVFGAYLNDGYANGTASLTFRQYNNLMKCPFIDEGIRKHEMEPCFYPLSAREKEEILEALQKVKADFEKRLNIWWKKYGAEKLHLWTYWADA